MVAGRMGRPPGVKNKPKQPQAIINARRQNALFDEAGVGETLHAIPEGVPLHEDGTIMPEGEMTEDDAQKVGAISPESLSYNRSMARTVLLKQRGVKSVRWGVDEALLLWPQLIAAGFSPNTMTIHVSRINPQPALNFRPFPMTAVKDASEMYDFIVRNFHRYAPETEYMVTWHMGPAERARGRLRIPDNTHEAPAPPPSQNGNSTPYGLGAPPQQPQYPAPAPQYPAQYPAAAGFVAGGSPSPYPPPPYYPYPPPPWMQGPPDPWHTDGSWKKPFEKYWEKEHEEPASAVAPPPPPPAAPAQAPVDPAVYGHLANSYGEVQRMQQLIHQNQLQMQHALGALEEMKRQAAMQQQHAAPPPSPFYGPPPGYGPPPPAAPPPAAMVAPKPTDPMAELTKATTMISGMSQAMAQMRTVLGKMPGGQAPPVAHVAEVVEPDPPAAPFQTMPIGMGENPPMYAYNEDGSPHWMGTILGNLPKIVDVVREVAHMQEQSKHPQQQRQMTQQAGHPPFQPPPPNPFQPRPPAPPPPPAAPPVIEVEAVPNGSSTGGGFMPSSAFLWQTAPPG